MVQCSLGHPGTFLCRIDDHDGGDKAWTPTRGHGGNSRAYAYWPQHSCTPGGGASQNNHGGCKPNFSTRSIGQTARQPTEWSTHNTEGTLKTSIAASASLFRAWRFGTPSAHPSDPESDGVLACAAKNKTRRAAARTRRRMPLFSSTFVGVWPAGCCVTCCVIPISYNKYLNN